jgi:hypothetical protein
MPGIMFTNYANSLALTRLDILSNLIWAVRRLLTFQRKA